MDTYYVELNDIDYGTTKYYTALSYRQLLNWVILDLEECGGGHADIYNKDGELIDEVEI